MKPILISSLIALVIGFIGGWAIKSASQDLESFSPDAITRNTPPARPTTGGSETVPEREKPAGTPPSPRPENPSYNSAAVPPDTDDAADRAKWIRLSEVLKLSNDQSIAIAAAISENQPDLGGETSLDLAVRSAGENLEQAILATLTPEQQTAFRQFQERSLRNSIESKAQQALGTELGELDLTSSQREQALEIIRDRVANESAEIADSTRLLLEGSFLPVGNAQIREEGLRMAEMLKTNPENASKPIEQLARIRKEEIEERIASFEAILTPGQMALYRTQLEEVLANWERIAAPR